jgi:four helix bundle protein
MRDYKKIDAWKLADDLTVAVYGTTRAFPRDELYGLTSQLRRAASSVPANIAEGSARESKRDYLRFLYIARGSLSECQYFIHLAHRLGYVNDQDAAPLQEQTQQTFRCLHGLIKAVENEVGPLNRGIAAFTTLVAIYAARLMINPGTGIS